MLILMSMQERENYFNYLFTYYYLNVLLQLLIITIKINVRTGTDMITQQTVCCVVISVPVLTLLL